MSLQPPSPPRNPITDISEPCPVNAYLDILEQAIQLADNPLDFLQRSQVTRVRASKEQAAANHEYILAEASIDSKTYYFRLERTRGSHCTQTIEEIKASEDPELAEMGKTIEKLAHDAAAPSESHFPLGTIAHSALPGVPATPFPSAANAASADAPCVTQISKGESFSLKSISSLNDLANKLGILRLADDRIYRVPSFDPPAPDVVLHTIEPKNLSLLEFLLIVNQVHMENKMYSVFEGQCYWFAQLVFLLVQAGFCPEYPEMGPGESDSTLGWVHISRQLLSAHPECYLKLEKSKYGMAPGTWMSVFVVKIKVAVVRELQLKFNLRWTETRRKVSTFLPSSPPLMTIRYIVCGLGGGKGEGQGEA